MSFFDKIYDIAHMRRNEKQECAVSTESSGTAEGQ